MVFTLVPGGDFGPEDVPKDAQAATIKIRTRVAGLLIGGMSYAIDPKLKHPPSERPSSREEPKEPGVIKHHLRRGTRARIVIEIECDE